jgi:hypothetical protein
MQFWYSKRNRTLTALILRTLGKTKSTTLKWHAIACSYGRITALTSAQNLGLGVFKSRRAQSSRSDSESESDEDSPSGDSSSSDDSTAAYILPSDLRQGKPISSVPPGDAGPEG